MPCGHGARAAPAAQPNQGCFQSAQMVPGHHMQGLDWKVSAFYSPQDGSWAWKSLVLLLPSGADQLTCPAQEREFNPGKPCASALPGQCKLLNAL